MPNVPSRMPKFTINPCQFNPAIALHDVELGAKSMLERLVLPGAPVE